MMLTRARKKKQRNMHNGLGSDQNIPLKHRMYWKITIKGCASVFHCVFV